MECTTARSCDGYLILAIRHFKQIRKGAIVKNSMCLIGIGDFIDESTIRQATDASAL